MMRVQIKRWGNSASVRLPASVMAAASLRVDQAVEITAEGGRVVIDPILAPAYDLERLLDAMTPDSFPEDADLGPPMGLEVW